MTNLASLFDDTIGFNRSMLDMIDTARYTTKSYPPYNIIETEPNKYLVELAVAGFAKEDISIEKLENKLTITGKREEDTRSYLSKGIATRSFTRQFILNDNVDVVSADYRDGILSIELEKYIPEEKQPRKIEIGTTSTQQTLLG